MDLDYIYVVLQGIGSLPFIKVYIIYIYNFLLGIATLDTEIPKLEDFQKKRSPEVINFSLYCIKAMIFFQIHRRVSPHDRH